jgi:hypothetical protein
MDPMDLFDLNNKAEARKVLGGLTPAAFVKLPLKERQKVYTRHLVQKKVVQVEEDHDDDDYFNPKLAKSAVLRQKHFMGNDAAGEQIVKEAREVYYSKNAFSVRSHWLDEFLVDDCADMQLADDELSGDDDPYDNKFRELIEAKKIRVDGLIRKIIVTVDTTHMYDVDPEENAWMLDEDDEDEDDDGASDGVPIGVKDDDEDMDVDVKVDKDANADKVEGNTHAVRDLSRLKQLKNAEHIVIQILGGGAVDGSDLKTQKKIEEIAPIVKKLITQFGPRLEVRKALRTSYGGPHLFKDITSYWKEPNGIPSSNLRSGKASFEELMQIQISEWTGEMVNYRDKYDGLQSVL